MKNYYEIEMRSSKNPADSYSICIIGEEMPTREEAAIFCKKDMEHMGYDAVADVIEIDSKEAHAFFDMENEADFPVFRR